jgi:hypothetical protein
MGAMQVTTIEYANNLQVRATHTTATQMCLLHRNHSSHGHLDSNYDWQPPTPKPDGDYYWNEEQQTWVEYVKQKN